MPDGMSTLTTTLLEQLIRSITSAYIPSTFLESPVPKIPSIIISYSGMAETFTKLRPLFPAIVICVANSSVSFLSSSITAISTATPCHDNILAAATASAPLLPLPHTANILTLRLKRATISATFIAVLTAALSIRTKDGTPILSIVNLSTSFDILPVNAYFIIIPFYYQIFLSYQDLKGRAYMNKFLCSSVLYPVL